MKNSGKLEYSKAIMYTMEFRKPWAYPAQDTCSRKTWEKPKLSSLIPRHSARLTELKESPGIEPICKDWKIS